MLITKVIVGRLLHKVIILIIHQTNIIIVK